MTTSTSIHNVSDIIIGKTQTHNNGAEDYTVTDILIIDQDGNKVELSIFGTADIKKHQNCKDTRTKGYDLVRANKQAKRGA